MASRLVDALGFQSAPVEPPLDVSGRNAFLKLLGLENVGAYLSNPAPPPIPNMPATPGKIPGTDDPRPTGAMLELGAFAAGMLPAGAAARGGAAMAKAKALAPKWSTPKLEPAGISGFHGSPHDFPAEPGFPLGRFRSDKIGTGEGNQAFSHGHYIGGAEGTARTYAPPGGKMYEVAIKAEPEDFLHWDKPIAEQSPQVQAAMAPILKEYGLDKENLNYLAGTHILNRMSDSASSSPAVSARLREAGIPGVRYLDEGSRAAGAGSHNYAVFDEKLIEILRKYGITGQ